MTKKRHHALAGCVALALATGLTGAATVTADAAPLPTPTQAGAAVAKATATAVSTTVSPRSATRGQAITFTGGAPANASVVVQYLSGKTWKTVPGRAKASRGGSYKVTVKHVLATNVRYRVAATAGKKTVYSNLATVSLTKRAQWYWLANYRPSSGGLGRTATTVLGDSAQMYGLVEWGWGDDAGTWRLNGTCTRLQAFAGAGILDGDDATKTRRQVEVLAGGKTVFSRWFNLGEGVDVDVPLSGANAVSVSVRHTGLNSQARFGLGNAKVLCTAPPGVYDPVD